MHVMMIVLCCCSTVTDASEKSRDWYARGVAHVRQKKHKEAIAAFTKCLELDPKFADAYDHRGSEYFIIGEVKKSAADFDRYVKLEPQQFPRHWKRGITLYYVNRFADGAKQFNAYEQISTTDVENGVWHFLCNARLMGVKKARKIMLKIGRDGRIPMMKVYELYKGIAKPSDVLKRVADAKLKGARQTHALFYAHLYLGLYYEAVEKDKKKALSHLNQATDKYRIGHYMWDVARVHRDILRKKTR